MQDIRTAVPIPDALPSAIGLLPGSAGHHERNGLPEANCPPLVPVLEERSLCRLNIDHAGMGCAAAGTQIVARYDERDRRLGTAEGMTASLTDGEFAALTTVSFIRRPMPHAARQVDSGLGEPSPPIERNFEDLETVRALHRKMNARRRADHG